MARQTTESDLTGLRCTRPWTEGEGQRVIDAWAASGKTVAAFARSEGLVPDRVYWWRQRLGAAPLKACTLEVRPTAESPPSFLPVRVRPSPATPPSSASVVSVWTRDGHRIEVAALDVASAVWIAALMKSLEEVPS
jgi:hypothetical protein